MRVLLDTNVILDILLQRHPWLAQAQVIWAASATGAIELCISASTLTDIYYIARKHVGHTAALQAIRSCLDELTVLPVDLECAEDAYHLGSPDFEDSIQTASAARNGVSVIVTRDPAGFRGSPVEVLSPAQMVTRLSSS